MEKVIGILQATIIALLVVNIIVVKKNRRKVVNVDFGIKLKNIDLELISNEEQWDKCAEEESEFYQAVIGEKDEEHAIEEFWDVVQSKLGALQKSMGISAEQVMDRYSKHLEKIKNRPR